MEFQFLHCVGCWVFLSGWLGCGKESVLCCGQHQGVQDRREVQVLHEEQRWRLLPRPVQHSRVQPHQDCGAGSEKNADDSGQIIDSRARMSSSRKLYRWKYPGNCDDSIKKMIFSGEWVNTANIDANVKINSTHIIEEWNPDVGRWRKVTPWGC